MDKCQQNIESNLKLKTTDWFPAGQGCMGGEVGKWRGGIDKRSGGQTLCYTIYSL